MEIVTRWLARTVAALLLLPSLLLYIIGVQRVLWWMATWIPSRFYVVYPYLQEGAPWLLMGSLGLLGSAAILTDAMRTKHWLWLPFCATLFAVMYPSLSQAIHARPLMHGDPLSWSRLTTHADVHRLVWDVSMTAQSEGQFICHPGPTEIDELVRVRREAVAL